MITMTIDVFTIKRGFLLNINRGKCKGIFS